MFQERNYCVKFRRGPNYEKRTPAGMATPGKHVMSSTPDCLREMIKRKAGRTGKKLPQQKEAPGPEGAPVVPS